MRWVDDNQAVTVTTVGFKTSTQDGTAVCGQFTLRVTHKLDERGLMELLARYGLSTVFSVVGENNQLVNGKSD